MLRKGMFLIILPLIIGIGIYALFRSSDMVIFSWFPVFKTVKDMVKLNSSLDFLNPVIKNYILFSVPDGLWLYSFTSSMILIWKKSNFRYKNLWMFSGGIIAISHEVGQRLGLFSGTYDVKDLTTYLIATIVAVSVTNIFFKEA